MFGAPGGFDQDDVVRADVAGHRAVAEAPARAVCSHRVHAEEGAERVPLRCSRSFETPYFC
jgi:hypothetical protein